MLLLLQLNPTQKQLTADYADFRGLNQGQKLLFRPKTFAFDPNLRSSANSAANVFAYKIFSPLGPDHTNRLLSLNFVQLKPPDKTLET
jgi:hypothetical protein